MKYLFKDSYGGHNRAFIKIHSANVQSNNNDKDESHLEDEENDYHYDGLKQCINTRSSCPSKAMYESLEYGLYAIGKQQIRNEI